MEKFTFLDRLVFRSPAHSFSTKDEKITYKNFAESLYLASPTLTQEFAKLENKQIKDEKEQRKISESLYKYHSRSCSRCTPFALFAGLGIGTWAEETNVVLDERKRRETRLDMNYVCALGQFIGSIKEIRDKLLFYPNNSAYKVAEKVRYVDYKYINTKRNHQISEVDNSEYMVKIIQTAEKGARIQELTECIVDSEITFTEAHEFVLEIISAQILKNELEPNVTGENYFDILLAKLMELHKTQLSDSENLKNIISLLVEVDKRVKQIDSDFFNPIEAYQNIGTLLKQLPVKFEENNLFQTDLYWNTVSSTVNKNLQKDLMACLDLLNKQSKRPTETRMTKFAEEYYKRYEDEELPLLYVLDTEIGTGYANNKGSDSNPLIDGLAFQPRGAGNSMSYSGLDVVLHEKIKEARLKNQFEVEITDEDFKGAGPEMNDLPPTLCANFSMYAKDKFILSYIGGSCAANMLGRFAGGDKRVLEICEEIIAHEDSFYPDKIIAEIAHLPESRTGNILMRPSFRKYEIPYLATPSVDAAHVIDVADLYVSVSGTHVTLRSKKLGKEIIPRLTNAHNFSYNALPIYQFLCDLQAQNLRTGFGFHWGAFASFYQFKPRAVYKNVILKEATWDLRSDDIKELSDKGFDVELIEKFRAKWLLPEAVLLTDSDNTLLVEFNSKESVNTFLSTIKKRPSFTLTEHIFDLTNPAVTDKKNQPFENEFLAFIKNNSKPTDYIRKRVESKQSIQRYFPVGSEWMYYKIYTGSKTADHVVAEFIKPVTEKLLDEGVIDKWFFIRYSDPDKHIRVRFHLSDLKKYGILINTLSERFNQLLDTKLAWKIQTDTYAREIERYGSLTMELCENIFWQDSVFIANVVNSIEGDEGEKIRWITGFRATDELLNAVGFDLEKKKAFMSRLADSFGREHGAGKGLRVLLDKRFRTLRQDVELNMDRANDEESDIKLIWDFLTEKTTRAQPYMDKIRALHEKNELDTDFEGLMGSLIHMLLNRLFKSQQRTHELVVYDLLHAYYKSMLARRGKAPKEKTV